MLYSKIHWQKSIGIFIFFFCALITNPLAAQEKDQKYAKALQLYFTSSYQLAKQAFTEVINESKNQPYAYLYRGNCNAYLHLFKEAKADYVKASKYLKDNEELYFGLGYLANEKADYLTAIKYLDKAIALNPKYALAYNARGLSYQNIGKPRLALENYSAAIGFDSTLALAYNNRGTAIYENQDIAKATSLDIRNAIKDFDKAISLDPGLCIARRNRGMAYGFINKNDLALIDLDAAVKCDKKNVMFLINRGMHLIKIGEYLNALSDFKEALNLDPKNVEAEILLGEAYEKSGDLQNAVLCEMTAGIWDKYSQPLTNFNIARFYAVYKDKTLMMKYLKLAKKGGYFKSNDHLADFLKDQNFLAFKTDSDFINFRNKVRGNRM